MKKCLRCGLLKDLLGFSKNKNKVDGLDIYCKECSSKKYFERKSNFQNKECSSCGKIFSEHAKICYNCRNPLINCLNCNKLIRGCSEKKICASCAKSRENNPKWVGGKRRYATGYIGLRLPEHPRASYGYIMEHIVVMEKFLGRYLIKGETVHHKNGVKDDNRIENLELWASNHPSGQRVEDLVKYAYEIINKYEEECKKFNKIHLILSDD